MNGAELGARLRARDRTAAPAALNLLETRTAREEAAALVSAAGDGAGHVVGVTGPPGGGKSTLLSALLREWRARGRSVAVLAVDPSSKRSGGSLLGDRARIEHDPADRDVFIRSMAAGERLGGLAPATRAAARALACAFDVVVIETVGVGQSETDVAEAADTVVVVVQPGSGDALQFLKAGIMEVPDVLVVTKADLGATARRAEHDLRAALGALGARATPVLSVSSLRQTQEGIDALADALDAHREGLDLAAARTRARRLGALADFVHEHGERGLRGLGGRRAARRWLEQQPPELDEPELLRRLAGGTSLAARAEQIRFARHTNRFEAIERFYGDALGLERIGAFEGHAGYRGVMFGLPGRELHLEFTADESGLPGDAPTRDNLLVLYVPDRAAVDAAIERLARHGHEPVAPENPYWTSVQAICFEDPDGWGVVIVPRRLPP